jgi:hypothetical protein
MERRAFLKWGMVMGGTLDTLTTTARSRTWLVPSRSGERPGEGNWGRTRINRPTEACWLSSCLTIACRRG